MENIIALLILALVDGALIVYIYLNNRETAKERQRLLNAIVAKNAVELRDLQIVEKQEDIPLVEPLDPQTSVESLTDEEFDKFILDNNGRG